MVHSAIASSSDSSKAHGLIMNCLIFVAVIFAAVVANASGQGQGSPPPPPPPPPPAPAHFPAHGPYRHRPRYPGYGYRPHYGPPKHVGGGAGGLASILPFLLLGKGGSSGNNYYLCFNTYVDFEMLLLSGIKDLLPLMLLGGGKGGKGGLNSLLPFLLLGDKSCKNPAGCVEPNVGTWLCGAGASAGPCCICPKKTSLFG